MSVTKVVLAKLSPTMEEGTIVKWSKNEGDPVKVGDVLAEIETDKANMEMEALGAGILRKVLVPAGGKAPVGALIGVDRRPARGHHGHAGHRGPRAAVAPPAAAAPALAAPAPTPPPAPAPPVAPAAAPPTWTRRPAPRPRPRRRRPRADASQGQPARPRHRPARTCPWTRSPGTGPGGRIVERDVARLPGRALRPPSPRHRLRGRGAVDARPGAVVPRPRPPRRARIIPLSSMRKTIARAPRREHVHGPPLLRHRRHRHGPGGARSASSSSRREKVKVSFNDLVVKACAKALTRYPMVNASFTPEAIITHAEVHIGVAVSPSPTASSCPWSAMPTARHVVEISREVKDLAGRAKEKKLRPEEFMGSTFSISNLGMMDVGEFTAIINPSGDRPSWPWVPSARSRWWWRTASRSATG